MTTTVTVKGQVTLPKAVREAAGLKPGDKVEVRATASGGVYIEKPGAAAAYRARLEALAKQRLIRGGMTTVPTCLDVIASDPAWFVWSIDAMGRQSMVGHCSSTRPSLPSCRMDTLAEVEKAVDGLEVRLDRIPREALFLAGQACGVRTGVLPDFFIGAHAQVTGLPLLTRDVGRYRTYFPKVQLIAPDSAR